ncbi:MAG: hypothetical protein KBD78_13900 [Oligoflexales bacterium]|nr:hypothetical protein [Oligoflexales bacterium]
MNSELLRRLAFFALVVAFISSCTKSCESELTPEAVVERYLEVALNMTEIQEKQNLLQITTGALKAAISSASEDVIRQAYINRAYKMQSYSVVERRDRTPRETEITFILSYRDLGEKASRSAEAESATITTENTVVVVREDDRWLIREVLGHKTTIDFPVSADSQITARAP